MEDVKPDTKPDVKDKVTLNVTFNETSVKFSLGRGVPFKRMFKAAHDKWNMVEGTLRFTFDGTLLKADETPADHDMENDDMIHAHTMQIGGAR